MRTDRRMFLAGWIAVAGSPLLLSGQIDPNPQPNYTPKGTSRQSSNPPPQLPTSADDIPAGPDSTSPGNSRAILEQDQKDLKHDCDELASMASDLKTQVDAVDTTKVLSLDLVHKADAIEKLAHRIKTLAQGQ